MSAVVPTYTDPRLNAIEVINKTPSSFLTPDAITTLADVVSGALPKYVPAFSSILFGLVVSIVIMIGMAVLAMIDRSRNKKSKNYIDRIRWLLIIALGVILAIKVGDYVQEKHYTIQCIKTNRQHYANIHWLRLYNRANSGDGAA